MVRSSDCSSEASDGFHLSVDQGCGQYTRMSVCVHVCVRMFVTGVHNDYTFELDCEVISPSLHYSFGLIVKLLAR